VADKQAGNSPACPSQSARTVVKATAANEKAGRTTAAAAPTAAVAVSVGSGEEGPLQQTAASEGCRRARCSAQISLDAPASALCVPFRS